MSKKGLSLLIDGKDLKMKKVLFIMLLLLSSTVFGIETNLHNMTSMIGDNCVFNRGELKYEKSICENKNRVEIKVVKNHLADTDKNKTISLIRNYIVFDFITFKYLLFDFNWKEAKI